MNPDIRALRTRLEQQAGAVSSPGACTVDALLTAFTSWGRTRWAARNGRGEAENCRDAFREIRLLYGDEPADSMSPVRLVAVATLMQERGLAPSTVRQRVGKIRRAFRWGVGRMLVPSSVLAGLTAVESVRGSPAAVQPVSVEDVERTLPAIARPRMSVTSNPVATMVRLQLLTGMRPGEVVGMRGADVTTCDAAPLAPATERDVVRGMRRDLLDLRGGVHAMASSWLGRNGHRPWMYRPASHKTAHHGHARVIPLGPQAVKLILPFMRDGHLFTTKRGTPYTVTSYGQAVRRACDAAGVTRWSPNQLRHTWAVLARQRAGLETAQQGLGHRTRAMTEHYAPAGIELAMEYAAMHG